MDLQERILPSLPVESPLGYFHYDIVFWSTVVVAIVGVIGWRLGRKLQVFPGRRQVAAELVVGWFDGLCRDVLGNRRGRRYLPLFGSLFLFIIVCNVIGLVPLSGLTLGLFPEHGLEIGGEPYIDFDDDHAWEPGEPTVGENGDPNWEKPGRRAGVLIPQIEEPTKNVNVPVGLSLFLAAMMYGAAVVIKGARSLGKSLFEPMWFMFPLNLIGQVAQVASVSFRLFGNIFGGAVILVVVPAVVYSLLPVWLSPALNALFYLILVGFLGLFVGIIQAFVFTMLWITYHSEHVAEEG